MAPPPRPTPQKTMLTVLSWRGWKFICSWEARNQFRDQHCLGKGGPANTKSSFFGGHTEKFISRFPNGATTPTKTMLKVLSLRDRKMFLAKPGTDFAPSFVWVCMVEGDPAHPKLSFGGGCRISLETVWNGPDTTTPKSAVSGGRFGVRSHYFSEAVLSGRGVRRFSTASASHHVE